MQPIDLSLALNATDGDIELLRDVVEAFLEEYPTLLVQLEAAIQAGDKALVQRSSHTIKGTLRLFGKVPSQELAGLLEEMGTSGSLENATETYQSLKLSLAALRPQLLESMKHMVVGSG